MKPGDLLEVPGHTRSHHYTVAGIHLGAVGQESVVELTSDSHAAPDAHGIVHPIIVPLRLLECSIEAKAIYHYPRTNLDGPT